MFQSLDTDLYRVIIIGSGNWPSPYQLACSVDCKQVVVVTIKWIYMYSAHHQMHCFMQSRTWKIYYAESVKNVKLLCSALANMTDQSPQTSSSTHVLVKCFWHKTEPHHLWELAHICICKSSSENWILYCRLYYRYWLNTQHLTHSLSVISLSWSGLQGIQSLLATPGMRQEYLLDGTTVHCPSAHTLTFTPWGNLS